MVADIILAFLNPELWHRLFYFLGTKEGVLLERVIELVIYLILSYMVVSEYLRSKREELRYFIFAFVALLFLRMLSVALNLNIVFGGYNEAELSLFLPVFINAVQLITLFLLMNAFLFPLLAHFFGRMKRVFFWQTAIFVALFMLGEGLWLYSIKGHSV